MSSESIEKIKLWIAEHGVRGAAKKLIDTWLKSKIGLTSSDLADTVTFASGLDEVESFLSEGDFDTAFKVAKDTAYEMLEDEGMGDMLEIRSIVKEVVFNTIKENHPAFPNVTSKVGYGFFMNYDDKLAILEALELGKQLVQYIQDDRDKSHCLETFVLALKRLSSLKDIKGMSGPILSKSPKESDY